MYTDFYLSFVDQAEADSILYTEDTPHYANIDTLGILYIEQPEAEPIPEEGWHVNVRLVGDEDGSPLVPFEVYPILPRRVWA